MESRLPPLQVPEGRGLQKAQRRASFSPIKAIRSLSISSQVSHLSLASESDVSSSGASRRRTLRKSHRTSFMKDDLIRKPSRSSAADDAADHDYTSTRPTTPSGTGSQGTSVSGDFTAAIKSGALQPETSILKPKKEYLVLSALALVKFKSKTAAAEYYPHITSSDHTVRALSPIESPTFPRSLAHGAEAYIPLEKIVTAFNDEGTRPSFGIEVWWRSSDEPSSFSCLQLDFRLPDERDDWLKQIQRATKSRAKSGLDERAPQDIELDLKLILEAKHKQQKDMQVDIYPVIPRRPYTRLGTSSAEFKKTWRDASSFYLAFGKYSLLLAQFSRSPTGRKVNPSLVPFGLVTLVGAQTNMNDERFDLVFRLPLDQPTKLELSSRYHRAILYKLFRADTYLKPAWPFWTRREVFFIDGEAQQTPLPNGEDYGGFKTTLEAFLEGYHCNPVQWAVHWKNVRYPPEFRLLPPKNATKYTSHQLLAVFRALRFNDSFKSLSFSDVDFSSLSHVFDNLARLEPIIWLSRTGKRSLTRAEFELAESSSVLFQELIALLLGSESVKHIDLSNVLANVRTPVRPNGFDTAILPQRKVCEIMPPIILLWKSLQTRCNSINLSGNSLGESAIIELCRVFQNRRGFVRTFNVSRCGLDESSLVYLWEGLQDQISTIDVLDTSYNPGRADATRVAYSLAEASRLKRLNLAYSLKGDLDGPLFRPWCSSGSFQPWHLEDLDLSGWKINFDTLCGIMKYLELDESRGLRRLALNNCGLSGDMATGILCRVGAGRDMNLCLNENPLETGSTDWIDLIHGNEAPKMLRLDMVQFQHERNFNRLLTALSNNQTIEFLSMVGTGPPARANSKTSELLSRFFETNNTLRFLDLSGYSGKLEDGHLGWGLSGALGGLMMNTTLRQLRVQNHDIGAAEDVTDLCRVLAANRGLVMFDCQNNNFDHQQFAKFVNALSFNRRIISFPVSKVDRESAIKRERQQFLKTQQRQSSSMSQSTKLARGVGSSLDGLLTWIGNYWDSEAAKARDILARNRDDPANRLLELESEYLEAWHDDDLPEWLTPKPPAHDRGKQVGAAAAAASQPSPNGSPIQEELPETPVPEPWSAGASGPGPAPRRKTYIIEEDLE
ncbi:RNI-like protein [Xylariaceae sp. FL0804]|nr:RNI-like protein [Xylariaceae sp. FL0804]